MIVTLGGISLAWIWEITSFLLRCLCNFIFLIMFLFFIKHQEFSCILLDIEMVADALK